MYDHTAILPVEYVEAFERFIECGVPGGNIGTGESLVQLLDAILVELDDVRHYALEVNLLDLLEFNQQLATILLQKPNHILPLFAEAIQRVAERRLKESEDKYSMTRKKFIHPRLVRPPLCDSVCKRNVSAIRSSDVGIVIQVRGTVIRTGQIKMLESEREYSCDKCAHRCLCVSECVSVCV
jgi:DNA helicase MCM9